MTERDGLYSTPDWTVPNLNHVRARRKALAEQREKLESEDAALAIAEAVLAEIEKKLD